MTQAGGDSLSRTNQRRLDAIGALAALDRSALERMHPDAQAEVVMAMVEVCGAAKRCARLARVQPLQVPRALTRASVGGNGHRPNGMATAEP